MADGTDVFQAAFGITGASQAAGTPALIRIYPLGRIPRFNLPAGNSDLDDELMRAGVLTGVNAGSSTILIRTMADMGVTRDSDAPWEYSFLYQRGFQADGTTSSGGLFINPDTGVTLIDNDLEPGTDMAAGHPIGLAMMIADDVWFLS
jgi:hypothetical protein